MDERIMAGALIMLRLSEAFGGCRVGCMSSCSKEWVGRTLWYIKH